MFMLAAHSTLQSQKPPLQGVMQTLQEADRKSPKMRN